MAKLRTGDRSKGSSDEQGGIGEGDAIEERGAATRGGHPCDEEQGVAGKDQADEQASFGKEDRQDPSQTEVGDDGVGIEEIHSPDPTP